MREMRVLGHGKADVRIRRIGKRFAGGYALRDSVSERLDLFGRWRLLQPRALSPRFGVRFY